MLIFSLNALVQSAGFSLDATKTLVTSYIFSRLDYCNCLLMGTPNSVIQPLQKIQNFAARHVSAQGVDERMINVHYYYY